MAVSAERLTILAAIRKNRKAPKGCGVAIDNLRVIEELDRRATAFHTTRKGVVMDILWDTLFPGEPTPEEQQANTLKMVKVYPLCGSSNILEPGKTRFQWECFGCRAAFDMPVWGEK